MKKILYSAAVLTLCMGVLASVGCNKKRMKGLVPAQGVVTLNGEPVAEAMIMFTPAQIGTDALAASTMTDSNGKFKMTTVDPGDGVFPGDYSVTVVKDEMQGGLTLEQARLNAQNPDEARKNGSSDEAMVIHHLPAKYSDMNTTDLKITIPSSGQKNLEIALEGEVDLTPQKPGGLNGVAKKH